MKIVKLRNQANELPSFLITGGKLRMTGNIQHGDLIQVDDKVSMTVLLKYLTKEINRKK